MACKCCSTSSRSASGRFFRLRLCPGIHLVTTKLAAQRLQIFPAQRTQGLAKDLFSHRLTLKIAQGLKCLAQSLPQRIVQLGDQAITDLLLPVRG